MRLHAIIRLQRGPVELAVRADRQLRRARRSRCGCMKRRKLAPEAGRAAAPRLPRPSRPRPARSPGPAARRERRTRPPRLTAPLASAASSISVGLTRLPLTLIIASSRPTKAEQPVVARHDRVARPDRHAAIPAERRRRPEALGGALRIVPIALGDQRPGMDQFALLARRASLPSGRTTITSAKGMAVPTLSGCSSTSAGSRLGRAEGFGEAVHQVSFALRETARASGARTARADGRRCWSGVRSSARLAGQSARPAAARAAERRPAR